ncbi:MAG: hypothetical protein GY820_06120, partial [Gammaproteobacteria bacterium]|nr:hypothetical protein [Gammaproteobacteria bacterium]
LNKSSYEVIAGLEEEASDDQCSHTSEPVEDNTVPGTEVVWSDRLSQEDELEEANASLRMASEADKWLQAVQQLMEANQKDKQEERENREKDKQEQREYLDEQMRKFHEEMSGNILQVWREMNGHFSGDDDWNKEEEVDNPQISSVSRNASRSRENEEGGSDGEGHQPQQGVPNQITPVSKDQSRKKAKNRDGTQSQSARKSSPERGRSSQADMIAWTQQYADQPSSLRQRANSNRPSQG